MQFIGQREKKVVSNSGARVVSNNGKQVIKNPTGWLVAVKQFVGQKIEEPKSTE